MRRFILTAVATTMFSAALATSAQAQSFGNLSLGPQQQSTQPQASPGGGLFGGPTPAPGLNSAAGGGGQATPSSQRFLRKNRSSGDFVGTNATASGKFVGSVLTNVNANTRPAAADLVERKVPESLLNPPRQVPPRTRMYEPKLSVGFRPVMRSDQDLNLNLQSMFVRFNRDDPSLQVTSTVESGTARLSGVVGTEEQRELIEQMVLFEPGISAVQNDLTVLSVGPLMPPAAK